MSAPAHVGTGGTGAPITLATLPLASVQAVFDQVARHLLRQMRTSRTEKRIVAYHGDNGARCAGGALLGPGEYRAEMEGQLWGQLVDAEMVPAAHRVLIGDLQHIHDVYDSEAWEDALRALARRRGLQFDAGALA